MQPKNVSVDELRTRIGRGEAISRLMETPEWAVFLEAVEVERKRLIRTVENKVTDSAAEYAHKMGRMAALRQIESIAEVAVEKGAQAEHLIRERESEAA